MPQEPEWALTPKGTVVLSLDAPLADRPARFEVTARGLLLIELADGSVRDFTPPNRKVAVALRRCPEIAVTEAPGDGTGRRTTILPAPDQPKGSAPRP